MKTAVLASLMMISAPAFAADVEFRCMDRIGWPVDKFSVVGNEADLRAQNGAALELKTWDNNVEKTVADATITVEKVLLFDTHTATGNNGIGTFWTNEVRDYAVKLTIKTRNTILIPGAFNIPNQYDLTVSTFCTAIEQISSNQ